MIYMIDLCKYKDIFGKPNEGVHSYRVFNIAIFDLILTVLIAYIISYLFNIDFIKILVLLLLLGIVLHHLFCVRTTVDKLLFKN